MPRTLRTTPRLLRRFMGGSTLFNGSTSKIDCGATDIIGTGSVTVSAWIKPFGLGENNGGRIIDNGKFRLLMQTPQKVLFQSDASTSASAASDSFLFNRWSHITVTRTSSGVTNIYVNGNLTGSANQSSGTPVAASTNTLIGNDSASARTFSGNISEVKIFNSALTASQAVELYSTGSVSGVSPVANYALDDLPSSYLDTIGGAAGTGTATVYSPDAPVQLRQSRDEEAMSSLSFDGVDDGVTTTDTSNPFTSGGSLVVKFNLLSLTENQAIFGNVLNLNGFSLIYRSTGLKTEAGNGVNTVNTTGVPLIANRWYTAVATFDGANIRTYINGLLVAPPVARTSIGSSLRAFALGKGAGGSFDYAKAFMKNAQVYSRALTTEEVKNLHFNNIVPTTGLVLDLPMNEGAGAIAYDQSGNGNHGTISGATWSSDVPSKARKLYGGNLVENGDFSYVPVVNVPTTTSARWIDGTAGGSTNTVYKDLFGFFTVNRRGTATYSAMFDTSILYKGKPTIKIEVTAQSGCEAAVRKTNNTGIGWSASAVGYIPIKPSTVYRAKIAIKTEGVLDGGANTNVNVSIAQVNGAKQYVTQAIPINNLFGTQDFIEYELTFTTNASARFADFIFEIRDTTGIAYFSDIKLLEVGAARTLHP